MRDNGLKSLILTILLGSAVAVAKEGPEIKGGESHQRHLLSPYQPSGVKALIPLDLGKTSRQEEKDNNSPSEVPTDQRGLSVKSRLEPMVYLDLDFSRNRITNLTPGKDPLAAFEDHPEHERLVFGDYRSGFRAVSLQRIVGGAGLKKLLEIENASPILAPVSAYIGIVPIIGSEALAVRHLDTLEEARRLDANLVHTPTFAEILSWRPGDSLMFAAKAGFLFFAGVSYHTIGISGTLIRQGTWSIYLEKASATELIIKASSSNLTEYGLSLGQSLATPGVSTFTNKEESFTFRLTLNHPESQELFAQFQSGRLNALQAPSHALAGGWVKAVQAKVEDSGNSAQALETQKEIQSGTFGSFFLGIPFLFNQAWSTGKIETFSRKNLINKNLQVEAHYGMFQQSKRFVGIGVRRNRQRGFYGASYEVTNQTPGEKGYFGKYFWEFNDNDSNHWQLRAMLKEFVRKTGVERALVQIPTVSDLESMSFVAEVHLDEAATDQLMAKALGMSQENFVDLGLKPARAYIAKFNRSPLSEATDPLDVCADYLWEVERCERTLEYDTKSGMKQMWSALRQMAKVRDDKKAFTEAYAEFGEGLSQTAFSFQGVLGLLGSAAQVQIEISGTHVSQLELKLPIRPGVTFGH